MIFLLLRSTFFYILYFFDFTVFSCSTVELAKRSQNKLLRVFCFYLDYVRHANNSRELRWMRSEKELKARVAQVSTINNSSARLSIFSKFSVYKQITEIREIFALESKSNYNEKGCSCCDETIFGQQINNPLLSNKKFKFKGRSDRMMMKQIVNEICSRCKNGRIKASCSRIGELR